MQISNEFSLICQRLTANDAKRNSVLIKSTTFSSVFEKVFISFRSLSIEKIIFSIVFATFSIEKLNFFIENLNFSIVFSTFSIEKSAFSIVLGPFFVALAKLDRLIRYNQDNT